MVCKMECLSIVENSKCNEPYPFDYQKFVVTSHWIYIKKKNAL